MAHRWGEARDAWDGHTEVWLTRPQDTTGLHGEYLLLMSGEEHLIHSRIPTDAARSEYLVSRALLRTVLAAKTGRRPQDLRFWIGPNGKPHLLAEPSEPDLRFNLSHAAGLIACGVTCGRDIGVDVEMVRPMEAIEAFILRFFHPDEQAELQAQPLDTRLHEFWRLWVLKEAYVKAQGLALKAGLTRARLPLASPGWSFASWCEPAYWVIGLALAGGHPGPAVARIHDTIPLRGCWPRP